MISTHLFGLSSHTLEQADAVPDNVAKGFGRSVSLDAADAAGSEHGVEPCATAASNTHIPAPLYH